MDSERYEVVPVTLALVIVRMWGRIRRVNRALNRLGSLGRLAAEIVKTARADFDGASAKGGWSPSCLDWDDGVRVLDAGIDVGGADGLDAVGDPTELASLDGSTNTERPGADEHGCRPPGSGALRCWAVPSNRYYPRSVIEDASYPKAEVDGFELHLFVSYDDCGDALITAPDGRGCRVSSGSQQPFLLQGQHPARPIRGAWRALGYVRRAAAVAAYD